MPNGDCNGANDCAAVKAARKAREAKAEREKLNKKHKGRIGENARQPTKGVNDSNRQSGKGN